MNLALWRVPARAFQRVALPLASYYFVTLALPLANGAAHAGAPFVRHAAIVVVVPAVLVVLGCAIRETARWLTRAALPPYRSVIFCTRKLPTSPT